MSGSQEGGAKARETMLEKYGKDYFVKMGRTGGQRKNPNKGFGSNRELASEAGQKGAETRDANRRKDRTR